MKNKYLYFYYAFLFLILIFYTNMSGSPSMLIRLGYLVALVIPLLNNITLFPTVILCALCISKNTFAYPFMPTEMYYYSLLSFGFAFLSLSQRGFRSSINPLFVILLFYIFIIDALLQVQFKPMLTIVFILILLYFCAEKDLDKSTMHLPFVFLILSLAMSYWILFCPDARINTYNSVNDMEQVGWRDPNYIGCALGTGIVIAVRELLVGKRDKLSLFSLIVLLVLAVVSLLSLASRGITVAVALSIAILVFFSNVKRKTKTMAAIGLAIMMIFLYSNQYADFIIARFNVDDGTGSGRTTIWLLKLEAFFQEGDLLNLLFGFGFDQGTLLAGKGNPLSTHNDLIGILLYYGLVGLFLFFAVLLYPIRICSKRIRPQIIALLTYLIICSFDIEPLSYGNIAYMGFYFYVAQLARRSRLIGVDNE